MTAWPEWKDIESAPRDWTDVLVFSPKHEGFNCEGVFSAYYDTEDKVWRAADMEVQPTHWLPLPIPPAQAGEGQ